MDDFDALAVKPAEATDQLESPPADVPADNQKDDSSWVIENSEDGAAAAAADPPSSLTSIELPATDGIPADTPSTAPLDGNLFDSVAPPENTIVDEYEPLPPAENTASDYSANDRFADDSLSGMFTSDSLSPLREITKKREEEIAAKDAEEQRKIDELRAQAKSELDRWYKERERQMEQNRQKMKSTEDDQRTKALEKSSKETCDWSKVIRLLEFNDGTQLSKSKRDLTRMKSCLLTARRASENRKATSNGQ